MQMFVAPPGVGGARKDNLECVEEAHGRSLENLNFIQLEKGSRYTMVNNGDGKPVCSQSTLNRSQQHRLHVEIFRDFLVKIL